MWFPNPTDKDGNAYERPSTGLGHHLPKEWAFISKLEEGSACRLEHPPLPQKEDLDETGPSVFIGIVELVSVTTTANNGEHYMAV